MTGPAPQLNLLRLAPELQRAADLRTRLLRLTSHHLATDRQRDQLRRLLGELQSATWTDGYQAALQEMSR